MALPGFLADWQSALQHASSTGASDLLLASGQLPLLCVHADWKPLANDPMDDAVLRSWIEQIGGSAAERVTRDSGPVVFAREWGKAGNRVRVTLARQAHGVTLALRLIHRTAPLLPDSGAPANLPDLLLNDSGLLLIGGGAGAGRSTLLASSVAHIAATSYRRILYLAKPLEFILPSKQSVVESIDLSVEPRPLRDLLASASARDIDVLAVDAPLTAPDAEQIVALAQAGIFTLVVTSGSTTGELIAGFLALVPEGVRRSQARGFLAESLLGAYLQILARRSDQKGLLPLHEILLRSRPLSDAIREGRWEAIPKIMSISRHEGMQLSADALEDALKKNLIAGSEAFHKSRYKTRFLTHGPQEWQSGAV